ncbi:D-alanyl-D-alanine carboxypeptidase family protein [Jeotgalibacillus haloalkalitolerans]|uniref:serine-type D-Ala-D-Ala carboxypeptidase n=1 Tax=Jeotgalibacillus haloalkalitolerans TaxID=3104292 RepID=A0ABU5KRN8_9BACL|nr:D-alanyl-D-alanine carboxypeptidase family protein [Jeotgalibacillus sp. HH7-29]MDZ5713822.1 D-alanyl-D-alanine carboxypeptidase family protein [Jeotgalibacillus sp. HH7-29]
MFKTKVLRKVTTGALAFGLFFGSGAFTHEAKANVIQNWEVDAAILLEAETGKVLFAENADTQLGVASMTKMMTEYLLLEAIANGEVSWDDQYTVTDKTYEISQDTSLSNVPLRNGEQYSIQELYEAMVIYSANAATIALAETVAGTEGEFVKMMNEKAAELELEDYNFVNSSGLNNADMMGYHPEGTGADEENVMSARGTAKLAYHLLNDFPEVLETSSIPKKVFREGTEDATNMDNWNFMLPTLIGEYEGVDGIKTGTTDFAGYTFTGTAERDGMRLISVVMNATDENGVGSYAARFGATAELFDYGFGNFSMQEILPANYTVEGQDTLAVDKGTEDTVGIESTEPVQVILENGQDPAEFTPELVLDESLLNEDGELTAPIEEGAQVGTINMAAAGGEYGFLDDSMASSLESEVVTTESVEKANWFILSMRAVGGFFGGLWDTIVTTVKGWF